MICQLRDLHSEGVTLLETRMQPLLGSWSALVLPLYKEYQDDPLRCCPWCTESQRREAVHAGNDRKQRQVEEKKRLITRHMLSQEPCQGISVDQSMGFGPV